MENKKKVIVIIQARYLSSRLPGKVLKKINNKTILEILHERISKSKSVKKIIIACSKNKHDIQIVNLCKKLNFNYFVGSEKNVLDRYYKAALLYKAENIMRITADCPLTDPQLIDKLTNLYFKYNLDYVSNILPPSYPDGLDLELFKFKCLKEAYLNSKTADEKEHVTKFIINNKKFKKKNLLSKVNYSFLRITLDENVDFYVIKKIFENFKFNLNFSFKDIINLYKKNNNLFKMNVRIKRNEGSRLNSGQKFWRRAKNIIPGGTMLFSKNPDLYLPNAWPAYFSKTKGCYIWDLDRKKYLDFSVMGLGTNILGYSNSFVDKAVKKAIDFGTMSTLNSKEEILLAERLVHMHNWSDMVRFTRTGGEASAIAIRAARALTNRNTVAVCGYHGWQDWYLSANLNNKNNLDSLLMKNISTAGVPKSLKNTTLTFEYNNLKSLKKLTNKESLAAIIMEVSRKEPPKKKFLDQIRKICNKKGIVLIFDECTSGFRETFGGLHLKYKVNPDICLFGKALGNGYAVNAVVGKYEVMKVLEKTFVSSTFWTERVGSVAALETLKIMEKTQSWKIITELGIKIKKNWKLLAKKNNLKININGIDALPRFEFEASINNYLKTYISQEFLKKNFLASNTIYLSTAHHKKKIIDDYFNILDDIFHKISINKKNLLDGPESIKGIR